MRPPRRHPAIEVEANRIRPEKSEVFELICSPVRAHTDLGWSSEVSLEHGVRQTAEWIAEHLSEFKPGIYNV